MLVKLQEQPLVPAVIFRQAGREFVIPVEHAAHFAQLLFHGLDIVQRAVLGVDAGLDRIVLGRQAEGVEAHRLEDFIALHPFHAGPGI